MRRGEIQSLKWRQIDFLGRTVTVGASKTESGQGRVIPLNDRALTTLQVWATNFGARQHEHYVFPSEHYGLAGDNCTPHVKTVDLKRPTREIKTAWTSAKRAAKVECRFHDLRHTACTRLLERGTPLPVVAAIFGWSAGTAAKMAKRYGHIGTNARRVAVASLDGSSIPTETPQNPHEESAANTPTS